MKIRCPQCRESAELTPDFALVSCDSCGFEMGYGEYVQYIAHNNPVYSDILGDYTGGTEGQTAGTLDEWDRDDEPKVK